MKSFLVFALFTSIFIVSGVSIEDCPHYGPDCLEMFSRQNATVENTRQEVESVKKQLNSQQSRAVKARKVAKGIATALEDQQATLENTGQEVKAIKQQFENQKATVENTKQEVEAINQQLEDQQATLKNTEKHVEALKQQLGEQNAKVENTRQEVDAIKEQLIGLGTTEVSPVPRNVYFKAKDIVDLSPAQNDKIVYSTVLSNIGAYYNNDTGIFTAPMDGTYSFSANVCTTPNFWTVLAFVVDGEIVLSSSFRDVDYTCASMVTTEVLRASQQFWIQSIYNPGDSPVLFYSNVHRENRFTGYLVHV